MTKFRKMWCKLFDRLIYSTSELDAEKEPIQVQLVIIRVIKKSDDRAAGVRFVYHE